MTESIAQQRQAIRDALAGAFPAATWTTSRQTIRGVYRAVVVTFDVARIYKCGCSCVTVCPKRHPWHTLSECAPKSSQPTDIVVAVREALRQVEKLHETTTAAVYLLETYRVH